MGDPIHPKSIVILDFGGQYAHLIARRVRQCGAYSEIRPAEISAHELKDAAGIILSGGPQSVYDSGSPEGDGRMFDLGVPVLGICYGLQWMTKALGGEVRSGKIKEYGRTKVQRKEKFVPSPGLRLRGSDSRSGRGTGRGGRSKGNADKGASYPLPLTPSRLEGGLLTDCPSEFTAWMSHGDEATRIPKGFECIATSDACTNAAFADEKRKLFALQFHPEVTHTECGQEILRRFVELCEATPWSVEGFAKRIGQEIKKEVSDRNVFMLVSGGVDSTVAFTLLNTVLGSDRVTGLLVDTGLMRKGEVEAIASAFKTLNITNLHIHDASEQFFQNLKHVYDPEEKRRIIGETFIAVQKQVFGNMGFEEKHWLLGQGTIYPDTIETGGTTHADTIKTHHNRVALVQQMIEEGLVVEPLKELYKDEVRELGEELGLSHGLVWRHPFPGPGLGVRILCAEKPVVLPPSPVSLSVPHVLFPIRSVGVQGDNRTYRHALALFSEEKIPNDEHYRLATEIPNTDRSINRVVFCLSHAKPFEPVFTPTFVTREAADLLREADAKVDEEIRKAGLYQTIWQFPVVLIPIGSREGGRSIVLRPVESTDAMTALSLRLPENILARMTKRILAIAGIDAVFLDLTNKPPGTIEWE